MSGSVNKCIIVGNLGRDPEVRRMPSGEPVVNLRVATSETWRDRSSGERRDRAYERNVAGAGAPLDDGIPFAPEWR